MRANKFDKNTEPDTAAKAVDLFVREVINPLLSEKSKADLYSDCWEECAAFGLLGTHISTQYGGSGTSITTAISTMESLGKSCTDNGFAFAINISLFSLASILEHSSNDTQKEKFLKPLCQGKLIGAYALTEEDAGSDAFALTSNADHTTGGYLLSGKKTYISLAPVADFALVFAKTDAKLGRWGMSALLVDLNSEGVSVTTLSKSGMNRVPMGSIEFNECFVPEENLLGKPGSGAALFEESQIWERSFVLASQVGAMQRQLDNIIKYVTTRHQFDQPIGQFQSVSNRVADMRLRLETSRLLLYRVAQLKDEGKSTRIESSLAKLHLSECFHANSLDAVRIKAASGYTNDGLAMSDLNDSIASLLIGGTNDIQRNIIARLLGA